MRKARAAALALLALGAALAGVAAGGAGAPAARSAGERGAVPALPPVRPAFVPGRPQALAAPGARSVWAPVRRTTLARAAPASRAAPVAGLAATTPEGTANVVGVLGHRVGADGRPWVRVALAVLPNGTSGWVPRGSLGGYETVDTRLDVDLARLTATLRRAGRVVLRAPIAAGRPGWPTPRGRFYIRDVLTRYASPQYGPVAFGTSARSPTATDWPAGGFVGIHGTDRPDLVPGRVSHGCIRLRNADVLALERAMPVGTPVVIR